MTIARIPPLVASDISIPAERRLYEDALKFASYRAAGLTVDGIQRDGLRISFSSADSCAERVRRALRCRLPLSPEAPLPPDTRTADLFARPAPPEAIESFLSSKLATVSQMAPDSHRPKASE